MDEVVVPAHKRRKRKGKLDVKCYNKVVTEVANKI